MAFLNFYVPDILIIIGKKLIFLPKSLNKSQLLDNLFEITDHFVINYVYFISKVKIYTKITDKMFVY